MNTEPSTSGSTGERAQRILSVLAMPRTVPIMRHMHMNGWFTVRRLCSSLDMDMEDMQYHLEALEAVGLLERKADDEGEGEGSILDDGDVEFRLRRDMPDLSLAKLASEEDRLLRAVKFYSNLIFSALERAKELGPGISSEISDLALSTNGWKDAKAKAVLSCFDLHGGPAATYHNFRRMAAQGVLAQEDMPVIKKVSLSMLVVLIGALEERTDPTMARLVMRVASRDVMRVFGEDLEENGLLDSIPGEYFRQV